MAMEDYKGNKKRAREGSVDTESEVNSVPDLKLARLDSVNPDSNHGSPKATHVEPDPDDEGDVQSPEVKRIQQDLLNILDDADPLIGLGHDPAIQELDSVIKSFEQEILVPVQESVPVMTQYSSESRPELGFLLEASDDELGLPPSFSSVDEEQKFEAVDAEEGGGSEAAAEFGEMTGYEFPIPSYEFGIGCDSDANNNYTDGCDFVPLGGLFEQTSDISELTWQPESLSAL